VPAETLEEQVKHPPGLRPLVRPARRLAVEAAKRYAADGITANALMPGGIRTGLQRHQTSAAQEIFDNYNWKTPEQGASTSVLLAASPLVAGVTGRYFRGQQRG
jgi:NAD(P)-dependent dehydrogenase (short-subunit alcohol dehydrogenase family)